VSEQGLMSPPTQYHRLSRRQFYVSKDPTNTNSIKVLKEKRLQ